MALIIFGNISNTTWGQQIHDKHIHVVLRKIGHELLLKCGDSTSRVLPIVQDLKSYKIQFENDFALIPDELFNVAKREINSNTKANHFIVEVQDCYSKDIVYSFEVNDIDSNDLSTCMGRILPKSCYELIITLFIPSNQANGENRNEGLKPFKIPWLILVLLGSVITFFIYKKYGKTKPKQGIPLGRYNFDPNQMLLILNEEKIELSGKEVELLKLLYENANKTLERDTILKKVWGNEGEYIGRTLDVFISKLRKKLDADPELKIVNIRGVGYKLIINVNE